MPFKPVRFSLASACNCGCEKQIVRNKDGRYAYVNVHPCDARMPEPASTRLGILLESGVQLNQVRTQLFENCYHHGSENKPNENPKEEED